MEFLVGITLFMAGALLNRLALKSSRQWANNLALIGAVIFLPSFCALMFLTNARPAGPAGDTPVELLLLFWAMAFSIGLTIHKWRLRRSSD